MPFYIVNFQKLKIHEGHIDLYQLELNRMQKGMELKSFFFLIYVAAFECNLCGYSCVYNIVQHNVSCFSVLFSKEVVQLKYNRKKRNEKCA